VVAVERREAESLIQSLPPLRPVASRDVHEEDEIPVAPRSDEIPIPGELPVSESDVNPVVLEPITEEFAELIPDIPLPEELPVLESDVNPVVLEPILEDFAELIPDITVLDGDVDPSVPLPEVEDVRVIPAEVAAENPLRVRRNITIPAEAPVRGRAGVSAPRLPNPLGRSMIRLDRVKQEITVTLILPPDDNIQEIQLPYIAKIQSVIEQARGFLEEPKPFHICNSDERDEALAPETLIYQLDEFDQDNRSIDLWVRFDD
jgi:hypothetical protein